MDKIIVQNIKKKKFKNMSRNFINYKIFQYMVNNLQHIQIILINNINKFYNN